MQFVNGVDVSDYQPDVNWASVKASGRSFGISKATESTDDVQDTFAGNMSAMRANGMVAGAYHFLSWHTDPVAQAQFFLSVYQPRNGDLPPALDCEACDVSADAAISQMAKFLQTVEPHLGGARMLLYMSYSFPADNLNGGSDFSGHPLWVAAYNDDPTPPVPPPWQSVAMWQFTDALQVDGIAGSVDGDRFVGTLDDLHAFTLKNIG